MTIRPATLDDCAAILDIYAYYITDTAVTFENEVPTMSEFSDRMAGIMRRYPYLVAEDAAGRIVGYAYASAVKPRPALDHSAETTIYLRPDVQRQGVGTALYAALESALRPIGVTHLYAAITGHNAAMDLPDPYHTEASERFHEREGYHLCGRFTGCAVKYGRTYDLVWMEKVMLNN